MILFIGHSGKKTIMGTKIRSVIGWSGGWKGGVTRKKQEGIFRGSGIVLWLGRGNGYVTVHICQNS